MKSQISAKPAELIYSTLFVNNDSRTIIKRKKNKKNINQSKQLNMNTDSEPFPVY